MEAYFRTIEVGNFRETWSRGDLVKVQPKKAAAFFRLKLAGAVALTMYHTMLTSQLENFARQETVIDNQAYRKPSSRSEADV
jgi:uncharacterized membrane protein